MPRTCLEETGQGECFQTYAERPLGWANIYRKAWGSLLLPPRAPPTCLTQEYTQEVPGPHWGPQLPTSLPWDLGWQIWPEKGGNKNGGPHQTIWLDIQTSPCLPNMASKDPLATTSAGPSPHPPPSPELYLTTPHSLGCPTPGGWSQLQEGPSLRCPAQAWRCSK